MSKDNGSSDKKPRGEVQVESLLCKSCGLCAEYCPEELMKPATDIPPDDLDVPVMNPSGHVVYLIHDPEGQCNGCGVCASACPEGAVVVYRRKPRRKVGPEAESVSSGKEDADE